MKGIPEEVEDWIKSLNKPFTIFFTPRGDLVFVSGEGPREAYRNYKGNIPYLPGLLNPAIYLTDPEEK